MSLAESDARNRDLLSITVTVETPEENPPLIDVEGEGREVEIVSLTLISVAASTLLGKSIKRHSETTITRAE